jgi:hypothetical protein
MDPSTATIEDFRNALDNGDYLFLHQYIEKYGTNNAEQEDTNYSPFLLNYERDIKAVKFLIEIAKCEPYLLENVLALYACGSAEDQLAIFDYFVSKGAHPETISNQLLQYWITSQEHCIVILVKYYKELLCANVTNK